MQSPVIVLCALSYAASFALASVGTVTFVPVAFGDRYGFDSVQDGLTYISILVGVLLGEQAAGRVSDRIVRGKNMEHRLTAALPGFVLVPAGLVLFGVGLKSHWIVPCIGMALANGALQIVTTVLTTYCIDTHSSHAGQVAQFINLLRQAGGFCVPFWNPVLIREVGYGLGFGIDAIIVATFCALTGVVYWRGEMLRQRWPVKGLR